MIELEAALLRTMIHNAGIFVDVSAKLTPDTFSNDHTKEIFRVLLKLSEEGAIFDEPIIKSRLSEGAKKVYAEYIKWQAAEEENYEEYIRQILEHKKSNDLFASMTNVCNSIKDGAPLSEVIALAEQGVIDASHGVLGADYVAIGDYFEEFETLLKAEKKLGISTTLRHLDDLTNGFGPGHLIIIAGRPSMGKSAYAIQVAVHSAFFRGTPFAIFSLEMSNKEMMERIIANLVDIESWKLRNGKLSETDWAKFHKFKDKIKKTPLFMEESTSLSISLLRAKAKRLKMKYPDLGGIVVDYLQLMEASAMNKVQEISDISRGLKTLARELKVPVIAVSQLSRAVEQRENKRPILSDLRESGAIEQDADCVIFLYRDDYYTQENTSESLVEVNLSKHRNGPIGVAKAIFRKNFQQLVGVTQ